MGTVITRTVLGCVIALALWMPREAAAQIIPGWNQRSFVAERIDAERVRLMREVEIEGEPGTANAGQKFFADDLQMNTRTGELSAIGNVVFSTPTARISADSVVFNTKTGVGTFNNASGIAQLGERGERNRSMFGTLEPDVYFHGETIEKIDRRKYRITRGSFTTCVQPTPRWEIIGGVATLNLDDYVLMRNAVVRVKDVPVFYLPLLYYPIQEDDRATGFLLPMYGSSLATGSSISNAFFWAINRSQDATVFHDWMFSRGQGMGAEYRYLLGPRALGDFKYYSLDEKEARIDGRVRNARQSKTMRGSLSQHLPFGLAARARVDYFTDVTVQQTYSRDFYNASNSTRTFQGGVSGAWRNLATNGTFNRTESFGSFDSSTVTGTAPGVSATLSNAKFGRLPVFGTVSAESGYTLVINRFATSESDLSLRKSDVISTIRSPLSTLSFLQVNAMASYRMTQFSESIGPDGSQIDVPVGRRYADLRVDVIGPLVSRVYNLNNAVASRMKHVIEPSFSVQRRTKILEQAKIPVAVGSDIVVGGLTQMTYGLANRLLVRKEHTPSLESAASAPREFVAVSVRQSYYTDAAANKYDQAYSYGYSLRPPKAFSPLQLSARAAPTQSFAIDFRAEYDIFAIDPKATKLLGTTLNGTLKADGVDVTAGWTHNSFSNGLAFVSNKMMNGSADLRLKQSRFGGRLEVIYDIGRSTLLNQRYVAFYNAQCCGVSFEYQAFNFPDLPGQFLLPKDRRFNMSFTLAGVGSFSNFFGAFGGGTGMR